ncbi:MAG: CBS domain-containing protein [Candidatus Thermoplasmatota archaeon]|nr:CBS domain-containing protein [Candidatus Thermoplasmatota archaeon]
MGNKKTEDEKGGSLENMSIRDFTITDEFISVNKDIICKDLAKKLLDVPRGAIFLIDKEGVPVGAVTAREFLIATAKGSNLQESSGEDLMNTNIMEIAVDDNISEVLLKISKYAPYAVVVKDDKGKFLGYFSPKDYHEALHKTGVI